MPDSTGTTPPTAENSWFRGLRRGFLQRCPSCGVTPIFSNYLKVNRTCVRCGLGLGEFHADDAPPYFTILLVGHIVVPSMLILEQLRHPPQWIHLLLWIPLTLALTFFFLPRIKGAVIGVQWANGIRG
jgi:uncharacterized protein (DUF983 family)